MYRIQNLIWTQKNSVILKEQAHVPLKGEEYVS